MDDEIEIIQDDRGLAVIGEPSAVERFLGTQGLPSKELDLGRVSSIANATAQAAQVGSVVSATSGRWVKLTPESAKLVQSAKLLQGSKMMTGSSSESVRAIVTTLTGRTDHIVEFSKHASFLTNPAVLAGAAGLMSQMAMQQQMDEISDYLAVIDEKVDDVLRAQKDAVVADALGVDLVIEEAMTIREHVGRVSEVTWSKVQTTSTVLGRTQAYALRQLDALAEKLERKGELGDVAKTAKTVETAAAEWVAVLAHCFRLQEAIAVLEIDRVLDASPEDLGQHRLGLEVARRNRLELISKSTEHLLDRMSAAVARANKRVLLNPIDSPAVVRSSTRVTATVVGFHELLGVGRTEHAMEGRRWLQAAADVRDKVVETGTDGVQLGRRLGLGAREGARAVTNNVASGIADRTSSRQVDTEQGDVGERVRVGES